MNFRKLRNQPHFEPICLLLAPFLFMAFVIISSCLAPDPSSATTAGQDLSVTVPPVISASTRDNLNFTASYSTNLSQSPLDITVITNNSTGYTLSMSTKNTATFLYNRHPILASLANKIPALSTPTTRSDFPVNHWGYSLDLQNFLPIPASTAPDILKRTTDPALADHTTVTFGAKVDSSIPAAEYESEIIFSVTANPTKPRPTFFGIETMQEMTPDVCQAETRPLASATKTTSEYSADPNFVPERTLRDQRDGKTYLIRKLADGNCWMVQNLALGGASPIEINSTTSDLNSGEAFELPAAHKPETLIGKLDHDYYGKIYQDELFTVDGSGKWAELSADKSFYNFITDDPGDPKVSVGNSYNWYTATARSGTHSMLDATAPSSICPKGWQLPVTRGLKSWEDVATAYGYAIDSSGYVSPHGYANTKGLFNGMLALNAGADILRMIILDKYGNPSYGQPYQATYWAANTPTTKEPSSSVDPRYAGGFYAGYAKHDEGKMSIGPSAYFKDRPYSIRCVAR